MGHLRGLIDRLIRHLVGFWLAAQLSQLGRQHRNFFVRHHQTHSRFAAIQLTADARQVFFGDAQPLAEEGAKHTAQHRAANQASQDCKSTRQHAGNGAYDAEGLGAFAAGAFADLMGLDLTLVILDQHADGAEFDLVVGLVSILERVDRCIGGRFILEKRKYKLLILRHDVFPFQKVRPAMSYIESL